MRCTATSNILTVSAVDIIHECMYLYSYYLLKERDDDALATQVAHQERRRS